MYRQFLLQAVGPCTERQYTDKNGQPMMFAERRFLLCDGLNTINAFATGDRARTTPTVKEGDFVTAELTFIAREWQTQQGEPRYETTVFIDHIASLWRR